MKFEDWDPIQKLAELRARSNQMWDDFLAELPVSERRSGPVSFFPEVDCVETSEEFRFYLSVPGLLEDDFLIDVDGSCLTIRGERRPPYDQELRKQRLQEWRYGYFERHFQLVEPVAIAKLRATYEEGVLTIIAPKKSSDATMNHELGLNPDSGGDDRQ